MKTYKMNVLSMHDRSDLECTNCKHRFDTNYALNPYREMCNLAMGKYQYCPKCGAKFIGCQVEGVDFTKCETYIKDWIIKGYV